MDLIKQEAERRLAAAHGDEYVFARGRIDGDRPAYEGSIGNYQKEIYGDKELGGTQVIYLSAVPIGKLGLPVNVPDYGYPAITEGIQHTLYNWLILPLVVLSGLLFAVRRNTKNDSHEDTESSAKGGQS
jgi:hypothetical protein